MTVTSEQLSIFFEKCRAMRVLVIGDVMLDTWVDGDAVRLSPEAPVPVVKLNSKSIKHSLGGAGNVAVNARAMGAEVSIMGAVGASGGSRSKGTLIKKLVSANGIQDYIGSYSNRLTTQKIRIGSQGQQVVRVDIEENTPLTEEQANWFFGYESPGPLDVVIIADYGKGVVCDAMLRMFRESKLSDKVVIDPCPDNFVLYKKHLDFHVLAITPNTFEAKEISKNHWAACPEAPIIDLAWSDLRCDTVLVTEGKNGMTIHEASENNSTFFSSHIHIPATHQPATAADVSGAGDTVTAVFAMALAAGLEKRCAAELANVAAGVVVGKRGTAVCGMEELENAVIGG